MDIDEITGLPKSVHIEYFLKGKSLGKTMVSEGSFASTRIKEASNIGIEYYDRFVLDNGRADSGTLKDFIYFGYGFNQNDYMCVLNDLIKSHVNK